MRPGIDHLIVTLVVGNESHIIVVSNLTDFLITLGNQLGLLLRDDDIIEVERQTGEVCHAVTQVLDTVEELAGLSETDILDNVGDDVAQALLRDDSIHITNLLGDNAVNDDTTNRGLHHVALGLAVDHIVDDHLHLSVEITLALIMGDDSLLRTVECQTLTLGTRADLSDIVETQHHIL